MPKHKTDYNHEAAIFTLERVEQLRKIRCGIEKEQTIEIKEIKKEESDKVKEVRQSFKDKVKIVKKKTKSRLRKVETDKEALMRAVHALVPRTATATLRQIALNNLRKKNPELFDEEFERSLKKEETKEFSSHIRQDENPQNRKF